MYALLEEMSRKVIGWSSPIFIGKANQGPRFNEYYYRWEVKCVSVLTPPIPPRGTPYVAGVDTLYPPKFITAKKF